MHERLTQQRRRPQPCLWYALRILLQDLWTEEVVDEGEDYPVKYFVDLGAGGGRGWEDNVRPKEDALEVGDGAVSNRSGGGCGLPAERGQEREAEVSPCCVTP
jgi:hypothetical protein